MLTTPENHAIQSPAEELANAITRAAAALLSIAGFFLLVLPAAVSGDAAKTAALAVYTASLVLLYAISTCYHQAPPGPRKRALRIADHAAIYILIAGTTLKIFFVGRFGALSTFLYIAMGWTAIVAARPIVAHVPHPCVALLIAGGTAYTAGVIFYQWRRLPYHHAIWHLFVVAGSALHFVAAWRYILPATR
jgi:hemolysin III